MIFRELKPRRARTRIMAQRRNAGFMRGIFSRFHTFKAIMKHGRPKKPVRWWQK